MENNPRFKNLMFDLAEPVEEKEEKSTFKTRSNKWFKRLRARRKSKAKISSASKKRNRR